jgi:hypothetical protein
VVSVGCCMHACAVRAYCISVSRKYHGGNPSLVSADPTEPPAANRSSKSGPSLPVVAPPLNAAHD